MSSQAAVGGWRGIGQGFFVYNSDAKMMLPLPSIVIKKRVVTIIMHSNTAIKLHSLSQQHSRVHREPMMYKQTMDARHSLEQNASPRDMILHIRR